MVLKAISLQNFRNFREKSFQFGPAANLIIGPNTSGKTSLLEAISLISSADSFRAEKIEEMIKEGEEISNLKSQISNKSELMIILSKEGVAGQKTAQKRFFVNKVKKKKKDFIGFLLTVVFRPEEIKVIAGSPKKRRDFLDRLLSQLNWEYRFALSSYQRGLIRRNKVLEAIREGRAKKGEILFWNQTLEKNGRMLWQKRKEFCFFVNRFWGQNQLRLFYRPSLLSLEENLGKEIAWGMTLSGPHRDDFVVEKKGRNLAVFGSRSEQRLGVFELKLAELEFIKEQKKEKPVLLLDDIFSELDKENQEKVIKIIPQQQTMITATEGKRAARRLEKAGRKAVILKLDL